MRRITIFIGLIAGIAAVIVLNSPTQSKPPATTAAVAADKTADEAAIRANIAAFAKAYNAGDAKAVAALFTADGQIEDKDGNKIDGRDAIATTFANIFKESPGKKIEVTVDSIRFIGSELAVEVGSTKETVPGEMPDNDRYTVLHVKRDGKWQVALARDEEGPDATGHEHLQSLAWMLGEWVDDGGSTVVRSNCKWSDDKNFLLIDYQVKMEGKDAMTINQRIGWDPLNKCIRSWVFDSEGGFGSGTWARDGAGWIIKASGVRPDGMSGTATNYVTPNGKDGYIWRSTDRVAGGETHPPVEVHIMRKPPKPTK